MQITKAAVIPVELKLQQPVRMAGLPAINHITAIFVRIETRHTRNANRADRVSPLFQLIRMRSTG